MSTATDPHRSLGFLQGCFWEIACDCRSPKAAAEAEAEAPAAAKVAVRTEKAAAPVKTEKK